MEFSLLIALLSLLVSSLSETRTIFRDRNKDKIVPLGISVFRVVIILDEIIKTGNELVSLLANLPISNSTTNAVANKTDILNLIEKQFNNLANFDDVYNSVINNSDRDLSIPITVGDTIKFYIGDDIKRIKDIKGERLLILTWKLVKNEATFSHVGLLAHKILLNYKGLAKINNERACLSLQFPTSVEIKEVVDGFGYLRETIKEKKTIVYDLTKVRDLRLFIENGKDQIIALTNLRKQLADFLTDSFSLSELVNTK